MSDENTEDETPIPKHLVVQLDKEDRALLERLSAMEKLTRSDIVRRALRRYAKDLGLTTTPAV
jgi:hypothetical protein